MTPAAATLRSLAIISPASDALFFFASTFAVLGVWLASARFHVDGYTILAVVAATSNGPHLISTWTRVYLDPSEWRARPFSLVGVPLLVGLGVFLATWRLGETGRRLLNSAILYWATWHFVAQNWGLLRIYQRKSGEAETSWALRLERPILLLTVAWCILTRLHTGPRVLFGIEVFYVVTPKPVLDALLAVLVALSAGYLVLRVRGSRTSEGRAGWIRAAFLACSFLGFVVPFQFITTDDTSAFAAAAWWHGFQYLGMVRHYHRNRWKAGVDPKARLVSWLGQPGFARVALYLGLLWSMAGLVYVVIFALGTLTPWDFNTWAGVVWISLTLSHYWLDGVIWKLRRPELARTVGIDVGPQAGQPPSAVSPAA